MNDIKNTLKTLDIVDFMLLTSFNGFYRNFFTTSYDGSSFDSEINHKPKKL